MRTRSIITIIVPSVLLGACAGGDASTIHGLATPPMFTDQAGLSVIDPSLPSADQQQDEIRMVVRDTASAVVKLCISPDGRVDSVNLLHRSSSRAYNDALLSDVANWRFTGRPLTFAQADTCEAATIIYHVPA